MNLTFTPEQKAILTESGFVDNRFDPAWDRMTREINGAVFSAVPEYRDGESRIWLTDVINFNQIYATSLREVQKFLKQYS